jgi:inosine-uridine nucleoside N-ribohydrolase
MSRDDCTGLRQGGSRLGALLADCCDRWLPLQTSKPGPVMYDLAPLLWRFRPDLFQTERLRVAVELAGTLTYGWTVAVAGPANAAVSVAMDAAEAKRLLMETLLGA